MPKLICMTPVKNEAWILHAFLKATSIWADYIIIADQNSNDGSREIALQYPKVILIENNDENFNESERQKKLINKAREIEGDKIMFGLDADEVFAANFSETADWIKILNSKPGDVFWFKWANISQSLTRYWESDNYFPWMFHDDGLEPHNNYVRNMHSMRIPYPLHENQMYYVNDFYVLHFGFVNGNRLISKNRFYQVVDFELNKRSFVSLARSYSHTESRFTMFSLKSDFIHTIKSNDFNLIENIDLTLNDFWYDEYVSNKIKEKKILNLHRLNIWSNDFCEKYNIQDKRSSIFRTIHKYLNITNNYKDYYIVKIIDRFIMIFFKLL